MMLVDEKDEDAMFEAGKLLLNGDEGIERDSLKGAQYIKMAADNENADAAEFLSEMYRTGDIIEPNEEAANYYANYARKLRDPNITMCNIF